MFKYINKFGKPSMGHRMGKGQFAFQFQRRTMPKNVQTTVLLLSFHMLARLCSKSLKLGFSSMWTENFQMYKLGLEKSRAIRDQIVNIHWLTEKAREFQKNIYFCFIDYTKAFDCADHNKLWKILKEMGIPDHLNYSWEIGIQVKKQQLEQSVVWTSQEATVWTSP